MATTAPRELLRMALLVLPFVIVRADCRNHNLAADGSDNLDELIIQNGVSRRATPTLGLLQKHRRYRRQLETEDSSPPKSSNPPQPQALDLNATVPYIFSARLYGYGADNGDTTLDGSAARAHRVILKQAPLLYFGRKYDELTLHLDGSVDLTTSSTTTTRTVPYASTSAKDFASNRPTVALFWQRIESGKVHFRETTDPTILKLAANEVSIQYRYGLGAFRPKSAFIVTWEQLRDNVDTNVNLFQLALLLGDDKSFAHLVYAKLAHSDNARAGFYSGTPRAAAPENADGKKADSDDDGDGPVTWELPGSGTQDVATSLTDKSDIGIPGEWLLRIDPPRRVLLCGAGFKGLECVESCSPGEWGEDCARRCHCAAHDACDPDGGRCPTGTCSPGWTGAPVCEQDIDECAAAGSVCPNEQPDCINTPGAFLCLCLDYDEEENGGKCKSKSRANATASGSSERFAVARQKPFRPGFSASKLFSGATTERSPPATRRIVLSSITTQKSSASTPPQSIEAGEKSAVLKEFSPSQKSDHHVVAELLETTTIPQIGASNGSSKSTPLPSQQRVLPPALANSILPFHVKPGSVAGCLECAPSEVARCVLGSCECLPGFKGDGRRCDDLDECVQGVNGQPACPPNALCNNLPGTFSCECQRGYRLDDGKCVDIDECSTVSPSHNCSAERGEECANLDGSFECRCADGFRESENGCDDIDECLEEPAVCGPQATCRNVKGGLECSCWEGYIRREDGCFDVDECKLQPCHAMADCTNLNGTFHCQCGDGFVGNGVECHETILFPIANDSRVLEQEDGAEARIRLPRSVKMFGRMYDVARLNADGFVAFEQTTSSEDEDGDDEEEETEDGKTLRRRKPGKLGDSSAAGRIRAPALLPLHFSVALHRQGFVAYTHINACSPGTWGQKCAHVCQCADEQNQCNSATGSCGESGGCAWGWKGDDCQTDVDECWAGVHLCSAAADCLNSAGNYSCRCKDGYSGDGRTCELIRDACALRFGEACSKDAFCDDRPSNDGVKQLQCICNNGFVGDGFSCRPVPDDSSVVQMQKITERPDDETRKIDETREESEVVPFEATADLGHHMEGTAPPAPTNNWRSVRPLQPPLPKTPPPITDDDDGEVDSNGVVPPQHEKKMTVLSASGKRGRGGNVAKLGEQANSTIDGEDGLAESADLTTLLFIVVPAALCGLWVVLIVVVVVVCCSKKKEKKAAAEAAAAAAAAAKWDHLTSMQGVWRPSRNASVASQPALLPFASSLARSTGGGGCGEGSRHPSSTSRLAGGPDFLAGSSLPSSRAPSRAGSHPDVGGGPSASGGGGGAAGFERQPSSTFDALSYRRYSSQQQQQQQQIGGNLHSHPLAHPTSAYQFQSGRFS